jgi:hypothetical protein
MLRALFCVGFREQTKLADGPLGAEPFCQMDGCSRPGGDGGEDRESGKGQEAGGVVEAEPEAELTGGGPEDAAAESGVEPAKTVELDGDRRGAGSCGDRAASASDRLSRKKKLGEHASELGLPAGFFFAGEFSEIGEGLVDGGIEGAELRKQLVTDAVASVDDIGVRGVGSPALITGLEERLDLAAPCREQRSQDSTLASGGLRSRGVDGDDGMDSGETFRPGSAKELHEDSLCLVVEGVGGED